MAQEVAVGREMSSSLQLSPAAQNDLLSSSTPLASSLQDNPPTPTFASIREPSVSTVRQMQGASFSTLPPNSAQTTAIPGQNHNMTGPPMSTMSSHAEFSCPELLPEAQASWHMQMATSLTSSFSSATFSTSSDATPRVHPHLGAALYISSVPSLVREESLAEILRDCLPVRISLNHPVHPNERMKPNQYYDWMPKSGFLQFDQLLNMERALATLPSHPFIATNGIVISPYPPPHLLPFPVPPTAARLIRPFKRISSHELSPHGSPTDNFVAQCPSPGELFDAVRPWGSVRSISVWLQPSAALSRAQSPDSLVWAARVEFWYEDEAQRFDIGFGQTGSTIKGWQLSIASEMMPSMMPMPLGPMVPATPSQPLPPTPQAYSPVRPLDIPTVTPRLLPTLFGVNTMQPTLLKSADNGSLALYPNSLLHTPPTASEIQTPWYGHVVLANQQLPLSPPHGSDISMSGPATPVSPTQDGYRSRRSSRSSTTNVRDPRREANKKWQIALDPTPGGGLVATGLVSDDGKFIPHGPGQHIRPAPVAGPGSRSSSGLVDFANVYIKNLDPDINSAYLAELFDHTGKIISARVMRDERGASRGFGFVSFRTPEDASNAIRIMHNARVGNRLITVSLHEPRMVRPDKIAERVANGEATVYGGKSISSRRSSSPTRTVKRGKTPVRPTGPMPPGTTDDVRLLSPKSRSAALLRRVKPRVEQHVRQNGIARQYLGPAVDALVGLDLGLIPLLHDISQLESRIEEIITELRDDPQSPVNRDIPAGSSPQDNHKLSDPEVAQLRAEIQRIDPLDVDPIIQTLLEGLTVDDIRHCLKSKAMLAAQYGIAKRTLNTARGGATPTSEERPMERAKVVESTLSLTPSHVPQAIDIDTLTLAEFTSRSINDMAAHLSGPSADAIFDKLSIRRPTASELSQAYSWSSKVLGKGTIERKAEIAASISKMLDVSTLKRSQKTKVARDLVNAEANDEAICELMRYPELLNAKVRSMMELSDRRSSI